MTDSTDKKYYYVIVRKNLKNLTAEQLKEFSNYIVIRKLPNISTECEDMRIIFDCCCKRKKEDLQVVIHGELITLSHKMFTTLYSLLIMHEIEELEYKKIIFRPKSIKHSKFKQNRDLEKSIYDLRKTLEPYYLKKYSRQDYDYEFAQIAHVLEYGTVKGYCTSYSELPNPFAFSKTRVQKQK